MHLISSRATKLCILSLAFLAVSSMAWAGIPASPPPSWIYDGANLLKPNELTELTALREQLEQETGARLVVLTLSSAKGGESPKSIAVRTLNDWNAGRRSALLLVMLSPRSLYIQPGTDLAPVLDAATSSSICSNVVAPKLRSGDRAAAIRAGLEAIAAQLHSNSASSEPISQSSSMTTGSTSQGPQPALKPFSTSHVTDEGILSNRSLEWAAGAGGLGALVAGAFGLSFLFRRKCKECGTRMKKKSTVTLEPTYSSAGQGLHTFNCGACGYSFTEMYTISRLVESTTTDSSWSSSSSDSSWSSSSSDSSSSSSSDGSGGGGSDW